MDGRATVPTGVWITAGFFVAGGALHLGAALHDLPRPLAWWAVWGAVGRALLSLLLAWGLWRRIALCRSIAMVYCLAVLTTDAVVLGLAFAHAPVRFPDSIVWGASTKCLLARCCSPTSAPPAPPPCFPCPSSGASQRAGSLVLAPVEAYNRRGLKALGGRAKD